MMQLIGLLDSPYGRRVAISLQLLGLPFEHRPISVFRHMLEFQKINPVIKAPTLICDSGDVLMDSSLILEYAESLAKPRRSLMPSSTSELPRTLRIIGLALAACEKSVQILYERQLRPPEKQYQPWIDRVTDQLLAAYDELENELQHKPLAATSATIDQAGVSAVVAWHFTQQVIAKVVPIERFPLLAAFSKAAETLPEFRATPHANESFRYIP